MAESGIFDTSAIIDLHRIDSNTLPDEAAITAVTLGELAAGPHATDDPVERPIRQERLQWAEASFDALPYDVDAARAYGRVCSMVRAAGRQPRRRVVNLMIAAICVAQRLPLYTRNPANLSGLDSVVRVIGI